MTTVSNAKLGGGMPKLRRPGKPLCGRAEDAESKVSEGGGHSSYMRIAWKYGTCQAVTANSTFELFTVTPNSSSLA
jgi:hypothetical protein